MGGEITKWGHRNNFESRFCNKLPYLCVLERIYFVVKYLLYLCRFGNCWTAGQTSHRVVHVGICLCFIFCRNTRIPTPTICRDGSYQLEDTITNLPLGTPIKHLPSNHLKNPATATLATLFLFICLTRRFLECRVLCLSEAWDTDQIIFSVGFNLFSQNAWLLLTLSSTLPSHWLAFCASLI